MKGRIPESGRVLEQCEVLAQHIEDWVDGGIAMCTYNM